MNVTQLDCDLKYFILSVYKLFLSLYFSRKLLLCLYESKKMLTWYIILVFTAVSSTVICVRHFQTSFYTKFVV